MKYYSTAMLSAAVLALASSIALAGPVMKREPTTNMRVSPHMKMHVIHNCATGFNKSAYTGAGYDSYNCTTPYIKCPPAGNNYMLSFTNPQPVVNNTQGIRFAYRCVYEKKPS